MSVLTSDLRGQDRALALLSTLLEDRCELIAIARRLEIPAEGRAWVRVIDTADADAWLIAWNPSAHVGAHDHGGSRGAVHVLRGTLVESYREHPDQPATHVRRLATGATVGIPHDRVHDVANRGARRALSLHVYAPRLTTMTFYPAVPD
jgi:hypothetical protein